MTDEGMTVDQARIGLLAEQIGVEAARHAQEITDVRIQARMEIQAKDETIEQLKEKIKELTESLEEVADKVKREQPA